MRTFLIRRSAAAVSCVVLVGTLLLAVTPGAAEDPNSTPANPGSASAKSHRHKHSGPLRPPTGTHHLEWLGGALHGNPGFHYGEHYNQYTMHIPPPSVPSKDLARTAPPDTRPAAGFSDGAHYDIYQMRMTGGNVAAPTADSKAPAKSDPAKKADGSQ